VAKAFGGVRRRMNDPLKTRRVRLLWEAYKSVPKGEPFTLEGDEARATSYAEDYGERDYYRVLKLDVAQLEKEGAIEIADDHRAYGAIQGFTPFRVTVRGVEMLREAGYPATP